VQLFAEENASTPIATFHPSRRSQNSSGNTVLYAPYLTLYPPAEEIRDMVMATLLEVEPWAKLVRIKKEQPTARGKVQLKGWLGTRF
jgi:hypothetical protein